VTADALRTREAEAAYRGLVVHADLGPATVDGDAHLAERLVANLVDNALRHNTRGGSLWVSTGSSEGRGFLSVRNTGPVVPPQELPRLLQPFQRIGADSTDNGDGLGLGLAIVHAIVNGHGATLSCRALEHGGLNIHVDFPSQSARPAPRVGSATRPHPAGTML
jgi:signal transduction histidine kinase